MFKGFSFNWRGSGFGNALIIAHLTKIVNDNGIDSVFYEHKTVKGLVDVPMYDKENSIHNSYYTHQWPVINTWDNLNCSEPAIVQYIHNVEKVSRKTINLDPEEHCYIPVIFHDIPKVPSVDVTMCTKTGRWTPYRNWPYFEELKQKFDEVGITYCDLNKERKFNIECLNYVNKSKLYLGLDTGMSHYVSKFANGKSLIIQSGFNPFDFWSYPYQYECIKSLVPCCPCFINKKDIHNGRECLRAHKCMTSISVQRVFEKVIQCLK